MTLNRLYLCIMLGFSVTNTHAMDDDVIIDWNTKNKHSTVRPLKVLALETIIDNKKEIIHSAKPSDILFLKSLIEKKDTVSHIADEFNAYHHNIEIKDLVTFKHNGPIVNVTLNTDIFGHYVSMLTNIEDYLLPSEDKKKILLLSKSTRFTHSLPFTVERTNKNFVFSPVIEHGYSQYPIDFCRSKTGRYLFKIEYIKSNNPSDLRLTEFIFLLYDTATKAEHTLLDKNKKPFTITDDNRETIEFNHNFSPQDNYFVYYDEKDNEYHWYVWELPTCTLHSSGILPKNQSWKNSVAPLIVTPRDNYNVIVMPYIHDLKNNQLFLLNKTEQADNIFQTSTYLDVRESRLGIYFINSENHQYYLDKIILGKENKLELIKHVVFIDKEHVIIASNLNIILYNPITKSQKVVYTIDSSAKTLTEDILDVLHYNAINQTVYIRVIDGKTRDQKIIALLLAQTLDQLLANILPKDKNENIENLISEFEKL